MDYFNNDKIFEAYYFGELSPTDKAEMQRRLAEDIAFAAEYQAFKHIKDAMLQQAAAADDATLPRDPEAEGQVFAYLSGEMSVEEEHAFEERVKLDKELSAILAIHQETMELMDAPVSKEEQAFVKRLQKRQPVPVDASSKSNTKKKVRAIRPLMAWRKWGVAASILLILGLTFWMLYPDQEEGIRAIVAGAPSYNSVPNGGSNIGFSPDTPKWLGDMSAFAKQSPDQAILQLREMLQVDPKDTRAKLRLSQALLDHSTANSGQLVEAEQLLTTLVAIDSVDRAPGPPDPELLFSLAFAHKRLGKTELTMVRFKQIVDVDDNYWSKKAAQQLKQIEQK